MNKKQEKGFEEKILAGKRESKNEANKKMVFYGYRKNGMWKMNAKRKNNEIQGGVEGVRCKGRHVVIVASRLSEKRKNNKGNAWRRVRRKR